MVKPKRNSACLIAAGLLGLLAAFVWSASTGHAQDVSRPPAAEADDKRWQAVATGLVEPASGEIKIGSALVGRITEVLVKTGDKVFAGELLLRLDDDEAKAKVASAEASAALRKRMRNDEAATGRAAERRKAEDAVADAEKAVIDAQSVLDKAAVAKRNGGPDAPLNAARAALSRAQERLKQRQAELRRIEAQADSPLPSQTEGQLNVARADWVYANAVLEKLMVRAPIAGTVLQVNAKVGELASPSAPQPLVVLGDLSKLRVRAELDELDYGAVKVGQPVLVRAAAFRERGFAGKVASIAPIVENGRLARGQRSPTEGKIVEVFVDLTDAAQLAVGMKVDVYFRYDNPQRP